MEQAVEVQPAHVGADAGDPAPAAAPLPPEDDRLIRRPDWWHRDHPVFVPLAGFFTGMVFIILIPGTYAALLKEVVGYERAQELFPFVLVTLVVPIGLLVPHRTRKFARYMLFGVVATLVVVVGVAAAVGWFLYTRDR